MRRPAKRGGAAIRRRLLPFGRKAPCKEKERPPSGSAGPPRGPVRRSCGKPLKIGSAPTRRRPVTPDEVVGKVKQASSKKK